MIIIKRIEIHKLIRLPSGYVESHEIGLDVPGAEPIFRIDIEGAAPVLMVLTDGLDQWYWDQWPRVQEIGATGFTMCSSQRPSAWDNEVIEEAKTTCRTALVQLQNESDE